MTRWKITDIYLDVDEVLAAWVQSAVKLLGFEQESVVGLWAKHDPRPWDVLTVIGVPRNEAWRKIDAAGAEFWSEIDPYPWAHELISLCESYAPTTLLTSGSENPSSYAGKAEWINKHLGKSFPRAICNDKWRFAHPGALLIDDRPKNCELFREAPRQGNAILFPSFGNENHAMTQDPLPYIKGMLRLYFG
jgi:5'(3')-deoxyribonucleotidase